MTVTPASTSPTFADAGREAISQLMALATSSVRRILHRESMTAVAWFALVAWGIGIVGDAHTTSLMMNTGLYEEANGLAAAGMGVLGVSGYIVAASLICLVLALLNIGQPRGLYAHVVVWALLAAGSYKLYIALSNAALWAAG